MPPPPARLSAAGLLVSHVGLLQLYYMYMYAAVGLELEKRTCGRKEVVPWNKAMAARSSSMVAVRGGALRAFAHHVTTRPATRRGLSSYARALDSIAEGMARPMTDVEIVSGVGSRVTAADGRTFLDFTCGIGVTNTGHCHPAVVAAAQAQMGKLMHGQVAVGLHGPLVALTNRLLDGVLPPSHDRVMFSTTGAEAVENAMRLARAATGKPNLIVMQGGYHGRSIGTLSLTRSKASYGARNQPQMPGVFVAPFPYETQSPGLSVAEALRQIELLLRQQTAPADTAAVLIEPVLGEVGVR